MKGPWITSRTEVRLIDMQARNKDEFNDYLESYSNRNKALTFDQQRFLEPVVYSSAVVRLRGCTQADLAGYLLNYASRVTEYRQLSPPAANCQTFTADVFAFLSGSKDAQPYGQICRKVYEQHSYAFLYKPSYLESS